MSCWFSSSKDDLIKNVATANSMWVTLQIFLRSGSMYLFPMTDRMWATLKIIVEGNLMTSFPMTNREWVTLHILWKAVSSHLFLWPTGSEWHCTCCERQSHHIFSYDKQWVSDIAHFVKGSLMTSFPMTNSLWVTLHILWKAVSSYLFLLPTGSVWHCTFCERQPHHIFSYDQ